MSAGSSLYGKCDIVEGKFYVATEFFDIGAIPIFPKATWLVVADTEKFKEAKIIGSAVMAYTGEIEGFPIKISWKSVCIGYLRGIIFVLLFISTFLSLMFIACALVTSYEAIEMIVAVTIPLVLFVLLHSTRNRFRANRHRARELAELLNNRYETDVFSV